MSVKNTKISIVIKWLCLICILLMINNANAQFYSGLQNEFGKNRVQYNNFLWQFYKFEKFDVYFYLGGKETALYTAQSAEKQINDIEQIFDYSIEDKIQFIVYNNLSDFKQSNIGLANSEVANVGGETRIVGSKVFIYFEGDHQKLDQQIRAGVTEILIYQLLYGGSWREMLRNSATLHLPEWYIKGLVAYISKGWNSEIENKVKDAVLAGKYKKLNHLYGQDAVDAGHAVWNYVAETYGKAVIPNVMYMTRVSRNPESGFLFVLGSSLKSITNDYFAYYQNLYAPQEKDKPAIESQKIVSRKNRNNVLTQYKISPDGKYAVYASNQLGKYKIYLHDITNNKNKLIFSGGKKIERINDYSYPLITWHPSSKFCTFVTEEKGEVVLSFYNIEEDRLDKRPPLFAIDKILDFAYNFDGKKMIMSASVNGQSDIYLFTPVSGKMDPITNDSYDDFNPKFIGNSNKIVFSSNRFDDTLRTNPKTAPNYSYVHDLFIYDLDIKNNKVLLRLTNTNNLNEKMPYAIDGENTLFIAENNNIVNLFNAKLDSTISFVDTTEHYRFFSTSKQISDFPRNIIEYDFNSKTKDYTGVFISNNKYNLVKTSITSSLDPKNQKNSTGAAIINNPKKTDIILNISNIVTDTIINNKKISVSKTAAQVNTNKNNFSIDNYLFEGEKPTNSSSVTSGSNQTSNPDSTKNKGLKPIEIINNNTVISKQGVTVNDSTKKAELLSWPPKQRNYLRVFSVDQVVNQFDNNFLNASYQVYTGGEFYYNPGINMLTKIGLSDVFENYRIVGGFRLSLDLRSNESFLQYTDRSKRLDKTFTFYRQSFPVNKTAFTTKVQSNIFRYGLSYPFSEVAALKGSIALRNDRKTFLAYNDANLGKKTTYDNWAILKAEYVFDNTINRDVNIYYGTRFKAFAEYFNNTGYLKKNLAVLGFDARHYQKIHRTFIWANRIAGSTSQGSQKLVYYLGSVDNWLNIFNNYPTFNSSTKISDQQKYAFQAVATNMRGFNQNARNGNNFIVYNSELRLPVFKYLLNRPLRSDFLNSFQVIAFGDAGSAWTGRTPWSEDNTSNEQIIEAYPLKITLQKKYSPFIYGYGWGMRSRLFGYFIRADWAHGIDDGEKMPRIFYLSLSLDF